jgi:hypothetical protein
MFSEPPSQGHLTDKQHSGGCFLIRLSPISVKTALSIF